VRTGPLIDADALASALADPDASVRPAVLDVRWDLMNGPRPDIYRQAHIPRAAFVDLDRDLAAEHGDGRRGRHPLPDPDTFIQAMRAAGVSNARPVVTYDDAGGTIAARAWWLLRHYGHENVAVLDGGLPAWTAAGHPSSAEIEDNAPGDFTGQPGHMPTLDADQAAALAENPGQGVLLDARLPERFTGASEPVDPRGGHIPGARNRSTRDNVDSGGRFLDPATLRRAFAALGATPDATVGAYCGSGVTAAHEVLALQRAGIEAALYPGSWSEWSNDPDRPVATGDQAAV
jgi:thiosulfate/3-mercaptopyruvate sulfurtransferase